MRLRKILLALVMGVTLVPAPPAVAQATDPTFTINGSGWGHMVGMSQYGARAMAEGGYSASQITGYYYANIRFAPVAAGFAILAGVFYSGRLAAAAPTRSLSNSGQHRAL